MLDPVFFPQGWSNGCLGVDAVDRVFAARGLPLLDREQFRSGIGADWLRMEALPAWWQRHAHLVTEELREAVWKELGEHGILHVVLRFDAEGRDPKYC